MRPRALLTAVSITLSVVVAGLVTPAYAATTPTIAVTPGVSTGYSEVTITGTADAGATVTLYETAYIWNDLQPATDWDTGAPVTAKAGAAGTYAIKRFVDSGFIFEVEAGGTRSRPVTVKMKVLPYLTVTSPGSGTVAVHVAPSPDQPGLPVAIQRQDGSGWVAVGSGYTDVNGSYDATLTGQGPGQVRTYRAYVGPDNENGIIADYSAARPVTVRGTAAASVPAAGSVQFTKIQYHGASGFNNEWFRLTNRTGAAISLSGWTVRDAGGNTYTFSASYSLGAAKDVYVHTGAGTNGKPDASHRYWGRTAYIWNNDGDTATLRAGSRTIDSCGWTADKGVTYC